MKFGKLLSYIPPANVSVRQTVPPRFRTGVRGDGMGLGMGLSWPAHNLRITAYYNCEGKIELLFG